MKKNKIIYLFQLLLEWTLVYFNCKPLDLFNISHMDNLKQLLNNKECQEWKQIRLLDSYVDILIQNQLWVKWKGQVEINGHGHWPATHGLDDRHWWTSAVLSYTNHPTVIATISRQNCSVRNRTHRRQQLKKQVCSIEYTGC